MRPYSGTELRVRISKKSFFDSSQIFESKVRQITSAKLEDYVDRHVSVQITQEDKSRIALAARNSNFR